MTNYDRIKADINAAPATFLPALLVAILERCREEKVFQPNGAAKIVTRVMGDDLAKVDYALAEELLATAVYLAQRSLPGDATKKHLDALARAQEILRGARKGAQPQNLDELIRNDPWAHAVATHVLHRHNEDRRLLWETFRAAVIDTMRLDVLDAYLDSIDWNRANPSQPRPILTFFVGDGGGSERFEGKDLREATDKFREQADGPSGVTSIDAAPSAIGKAIDQCAERHGVSPERFRAALKRLTE